MADDSIEDDVALATLLCSRLCHDLISPVGAISNGLELLDPASPADSEVRALLMDSARSATAALNFYRIAFGVAGEGAASRSAQELGAIATTYFGAGRRTLHWPLHGDPLSRPAAQLLLLMTLAGATATPIGGALRVAAPVAAPLALRVSASGPRVGLSPEALALLGGAAPLSGAAPRDAHLPLAARAARRLGVALRVSVDDDVVVIAATPS